MERTRQHSISSKFDVSFQVAMRMFATAGMWGAKQTLISPNFQEEKLSFESRESHPRDVELIGAPSKNQIRLA